MATKILGEQRKGSIKYILNKLSELSIEDRINFFKEEERAFVNEYNKKIVKSINTIRDKFRELEDELKTIRENKWDVYFYISEPFLSLKEAVDNFITQIYLKNGSLSRDVLESIIKESKVREKMDRTIKEVDTFIYFLVFVRDAKKLVEIKENYEDVFKEKLNGVLRNYAKFVKVEDKITPILEFQNYREEFDVKHRYGGVYKREKTGAFKELLIRAGDIILENKVMRIKAAECLYTGAILLSKDKKFKDSALYYIMDKEGEESLINYLNNLLIYLEALTKIAVFSKSNEAFVKAIGEVKEGKDLRELREEKSIKRFINRDRESHKYALLQTRKVQKIPR